MNREPMKNETREELDDALKEVIQKKFTTDKLVGIFAEAISLSHNSGGEHAIIFLKAVCDEKD